MVREDTLDRSHTTLAGRLDQKDLAAQSNVCLPPKAHNLATQLTFHFKGLTAFTKFLSKSWRYFKDIFPILQGQLFSAMVILQPIYLPAVAIDKTIFRAQLVWRQIVLTISQPLLLASIRASQSFVYQLTEITLPPSCCFLPWKMISDKKEV